MSIKQCLLQQGNPIGQSGLGMMYLHGRGVEQVVNALTILSKFFRFYIKINLDLCYVLAV